MFGLFKKGRTEVGKVEAFGKIPSQGDFVRTPSPSDELLAFEQWLARAMERAEDRGGNAFKDAFQKGPSFGFVWSGALDKKQRALVGGVMQPSTDAVGRRFPVVIAAALPAGPFHAQPHATALVLHEFFHEAADAAGRARGMRSKEEFHAQVAAVHAPRADGSVATRLEGYDAWAKSSAHEVWEQLFGDDAERASRWALYMLVEAVKPYRGQEAPPLSLGMRVPLGADRRHTSALWIDLVRSAAGWKATVPSLFVPLAREDRSALIQLGGDPPASVLEDLYTPDEDSDAVCDATPKADAKLPASVPSSVERASAGESVRDVLAELAKE